MQVSASVQKILPGSIIRQEKKGGGLRRRGFCPREV